VCERKWDRRYTDSIAVNDLIGRISTTYAAPRADPAVANREAGEPYDPGTGASSLHQLSSAELRIANADGSAAGSAADESVLEAGSESCFVCLEARPDAVRVDHRVPRASNGRSPS
jgi:hypothetical protein